MRFQITADGFAAALNQSSKGPAIQIDEFVVGAAYGYEAVIADNALHGTQLYSGAPSGYRVLDRNTCEFSIIMSEKVGSFEFGEIALKMKGVVFALATLQRPQYKVAYPDQDFNRYHVRVRITINDAIPKIELVVNELVAGQIWELSGIEQLPLPENAMTNAYLCRSKDANGNSAFCLLDLVAKRWSVSTHMRRVDTGKILSFNGSSTQISAGPGHLTARDPVPGRYILQLTSGVNSGQIRQVTGLGNGFASWAMPLSMSIGDTYELLRDQENDNDAEDFAFFIHLLAGNK